MNKKELSKIFRLKKLEKEEKIKEERSKMTELEKIKYDLEIDNLQRENKKLKNEWWKNPLVTFGGFILGIVSALTVQYINLTPQEKSKKETPLEIIGSHKLNPNQEDTLKK